MARVAALRSARQRGRQERDEDLVAELTAGLLDPSGAPPLSAARRARLRWSRGRARRAAAAAAVAAFTEAVDELVVDGLVESADEDRLLDFARLSGLNPAELDGRGALGRLGLAAARSEVLEGRLPLWCPDGLGRSRRPEGCIWCFEGLEVLGAVSGRSAAPRTDWWRGGSALGRALRRRLDRRGLQPLGRGRLRLLAGEVRLRAGNRRAGWTLAEPPAIELRADGVELTGAFGSLGLCVEEPWLVAEMLRLHAAQAPCRRPLGAPR